MLHRLLLTLTFAFAAHASTLHLTVTPVAGDAPLLLDSQRYSTTASETFSISRCSFLLSGFALQKADGSWIESPHIAWMDAQQHRLTTTLENIPAGQYKALRLHLGLDEKTNAAPVSQYPPDHPLNPNLCGLHWSWQGGYKFVRVDMKTDAPAAGAMPGDAAHSGSVPASGPRSASARRELWR